MTDDFDDQYDVTNLLPWETSKTRQEQGRTHEAKVIKAKRMRAHPASGAGSIKHDASNDETLLEVKLAGKSFTLNAAYVAGLYREATRQGKDAHMTVYFDSEDITVEMFIMRGPPR